MIAREIVVAICDDRDNCGRRWDAGRVMPATHTDPAWLNGDIPEACDTCGGPIHTTTEWADPKGDDDECL